ncbi:hypothetical protein K450DRAFT_241476 [Umbelopsis ramanniana AG]|uniref:Uncharacterized protein n=1 Tax=Umbelopsis ramanniana AG TaxID=1314678 RepID=A0AAD5HEF8_UMBRA|nr:uncharacterized protein K450DRAFT_241476 [Umbelopsis ramanniana AG]KAI8579541.1 hypothetical protein K450DRAFT_241476 [Umbelopsis ramanniana AG]
MFDAWLPSPSTLSKRNIKSNKKQSKKRDQGVKYGGLRSTQNLVKTVKKKKK